MAERKRVEDGRLIHIRAKRSSPRYAYVTLREIGRNPITRRIRRPAKSKGKGTSVREFLEATGRYHGGKYPDQIMVNGLEAMPFSILPPGSTVRLARPIRAGD